MRHSYIRLQKYIEKVWRPIRAKLPPSVSIIIPAHNVSRTIDDTLASLVAQSFKNWEAIVVDDASTDDTADKALSWCRQDHRIVYRRIDVNSGVSNARNFGLQKAQGSLVLFLDADDWIGENHLKCLQQAFIVNSNADVAYTSWTIVGKDKELGLIVRAPDPDNLSKATKNGCAFAIHSCLSRRATILRCGGFDTSLRIGEDWELWRRLVRANAHFVQVEQASAFYRQHPFSAMHSSHHTFDDIVSLLRRNYHDDLQLKETTVNDSAAELSEGFRAAVFFQAVWYVGNLGARGFDLDWVLSHAELSSADNVRVDEVASCLLMGVVQGLCLFPRQLVSQWAELRPILLKAIQQLFSRCNMAIASEAVLVRVDQQLLDVTLAKERPVIVGRYCAVTWFFDQGMPEIKVNDCAALVCRIFISDGRNTYGFLDCPISSNKIVFLLADFSNFVRDLSLSSKLRLLCVINRVGKKNIRLIRFVFSRRGRRLSFGMIKLAPALMRDRVHVFLAASIIYSVDWPTSEHVGAVAYEPKRMELKGEPHEVERWNEFFSETDPWGYGSRYEQAKYHHTLELLAGLRIDNALELACAEGHFTEKLAGLVGELLAVDISPIAVDRARGRCSEYSNVEFSILDLRSEHLPGSFDLIVCSEVLYYLSGVNELKRVREKIAAAINLGGYLLLCHANLVVDDRQSTGFDWEHGFGAKTIGEIFANGRDLELIRELWTSLYRVQLFRRVSSTAFRWGRQSREVLVRDAVVPSDPKIYARINWHGCALPAGEAYDTWDTHELPILMYHRISWDGPMELNRYRITPEAFERQLAFLRRHGYRGITLDDWANAIAGDGGNLKGRCVCLSFDDAYQDFILEAWPLLQKYNFKATIFVPTDLVGKRAHWDENYGDAAPLLDWDDIETLGAQGVSFGAHSGSHRRLMRLAYDELLEEGSRSRDALEGRLGQPVTSMAYPFGDNDAIVRTAMAACGFRIAVVTRAARSRLGDELLALPRLEVRGDESFEMFVSKLGHPTKAPLDRRLRYALHRWHRRGK